MKKTLAIVSVVLLLASAAQAEIVTPVVTGADAHVYSYYPDTNYGDEDTVRAQMTNDRKGYFDFDLSGLDDSKAVTAAELRITQATIGVYGTRLLKVFAIMDEAKDWDLTALPEKGTGSITWNNAMWNATPAGPQNQTGDGFYEEGTGVSAVTRWLADQTVSADAGDHMYTIDVTGLIKWALGQDNDYSDYAQSDDHLSILLRMSDDYVQFYSKEGDIDKAARLVITQVPEPATMGLLGLGFAGMAAMRRRRRRK